MIFSINFHLILVKIWKKLSDFIKSYKNLRTNKFKEIILDKRENLGESKYTSINVNMNE